MDAGVKVAEIVQLALDASVLPQVVVWVKSVGFVPPRTMLAMFSVAPPVLVSVTDMEDEALAGAVLGKLMVVPESVAMGAGEVWPTPVSMTVCGEPAALSATESAAVKVPVAVGVKFTEMVQNAPAATDEPHVLAVTLKRPALVPVMETELMVSAAVPLLVRVTGWAVAEVLRVVPAKVRAVGLNEAIGPTDVPLRVTSCVEPVTLPALSVMVTVAEKVPICVGTKVAVMEQLALMASVAPQVLLSENWSGLVPP